jgi:hypothetical protein
VLALEHLRSPDGGESGAARHSRVMDDHEARDNEADTQEDTGVPQKNGSRRDQSVSEGYPVGSPDRERYPEGSPDGSPGYGFDQAGYQFSVEHPTSSRPAPAENATGAGAGTRGDAPGSAEPPHPRRGAPSDYEWLPGGWLGLNDRDFYPRGRMPRQVGCRLTHSQYEALVQAADLYGITPTTLARQLVNRGVRAIIDLHRQERYGGWQPPRAR